MENNITAWNTSQKTEELDNITERIKFLQEELNITSLEKKDSQDENQFSHLINSREQTTSVGKSKQEYYSSIHTKNRKGKQTSENSKSNATTKKKNYISSEVKSVPRRFPAKSTSIFPPWRKLKINTTRARGEIKLVKRIIKENGWVEEFQSVGDIFWSGMAFHDDTINYAEETIVNRYPGMREIASKTTTGYILKKISKYFPEYFDIFPKTFCLPQETIEARNFISASKNVFIAKPSCSSQGNSIYLINKLNDIPRTMLTGEEVVIQEYINNPLLVEKKKFDLRIFVLVMGTDPVRGFLCDEGLARFCTQNYEKATSKNFNQQFMHLTNYSLNKMSEGFIYSEETTGKHNGTKRTLTSLWKSLNESGITEEQVMEQVEKVVTKFLHATLPYILYHYRTAFQGRTKAKCFQILGFDIMFDENLKPYLLEINNNPSLSTDHEFDDANGNFYCEESPIDTFIKRQVMEDAWLLAVNRSLDTIQIGDKCRSYKLIFQESRSDHSGPASLFKKLLEIYGWLSGFRFREKLTAGRFVKLATLPNMTDESVSKADYDILFLKVVRDNGDEHFMDFSTFIAAMEKLAEKMEDTLPDLVEYVSLQIDCN